MGTSFFAMEFDRQTRSSPGGVSVAASARNWPESGDFEELKETFRISSRKILEKVEAEMRKAGMTAETKMLEIHRLLRESVAEGVARIATKPVLRIRLK